MMAKENVKYWKWACTI